MAVSHAESVGPVLMTAKGDTFTDNCRIASILWVGSTSPGDQAIVTCPQTGTVLWHCIVDSTYTYIGVAFGEKGNPAPFGFRAERMDSAKLYVYLREE